MQWTSYDDMLHVLFHYAGVCQGTLGLLRNSLLAMALTDSGDLQLSILLLHLLNEFVAASSNFSLAKHAVSWDLLRRNSSIR